jgi:hypothetical protein
MTQWLRFVSLLVLVSASAVLAEETSPFSGIYSGKFSVRSANPSFPSGEGILRFLSVSPSGKVTGQFNPPSGELGEITGAVDEDGALQYTVQFSTQTYIVKGLVTKTKRGSLKGHAAQYAGRSQVVGVIEFDLPAK